MNYRTREGGFEYQAKSIFENMEQDYKDEQENRKENGDSVETFAEWLWNNRKDLGQNFYEALDQWVGIDEFTEDLNYED